MSDQASIDEINKKFWNQMCGTVAAKGLGLVDDDAVTLKKYDHWFFGFYPYLEQFIPFRDLAGKDVLEIGLGYGSVSQRIAAAGGNLTGLDIASGPVHWLEHRLKLSGLPGKAIEGSALAIPFGDESFDYVVSIGCLHHTGNLKRAISEVHRVLRKGGGATIMVYNATSNVRWLKYPGDTLKYVKTVRAGSDEPLRLAEDGRADFDADTSGNIAPETVLASKKSLSRMLKKFSRQEINRTNVANHPLLAPIPRNWRNAIEGKMFGLDLYAVVTK
jgi:ubiquinone/menaquinone biosynthesis C-methylase UbiE